ncbi:MAG: low molecular weight protein-tyrosine-phosphatase [Candidatus Competibacterales bacterium]
MGNICRSPMAEGVFRRMIEDAGLADKIYLDSAGTHSYHGGAPPDRRGQMTAAARGFDLKGIRARRVEREDLERFDYVLVMDEANHRHLLELAETPEQRVKVQYLMAYAPERGEPHVPDPYYGGPGGFEVVLDLIEAAVEGLLLSIRERYGM